MSLRRWLSILPSSGALRECQDHSEQASGYAKAGREYATDWITMPNFPSWNQEGMVLGFSDFQCAENSAAGNTGKAENGFRPNAASEPGREVRGARRTAR